MLQCLLAVLTYWFMLARRPGRLPFGRVFPLTVGQPRPPGPQHALTEAWGSFVWSTGRSLRRTLPFSLHFSPSAVSKGSTPTACMYLPRPGGLPSSASISEDEIVLRLEFNLTFSTRAARGASDSFQDTADSSPGQCPPPTILILEAEVSSWMERSIAVALSEVPKTFLSLTSRRKHSSQSDRLSY